MGSGTSTSGSEDTAERVPGVNLHLLSLRGYSQRTRAVVKQKYTQSALGEARQMSAEKTHELFELINIKKILDGYRGGKYFVALNEYVDGRIMELLDMRGGS
jgi:hypothetical protein